MANKDGVFHGRTRFNLNGKDLNRDWERPADPRWAPENHPRSAQYLCGAQKAISYQFPLASLPARPVLGRCGYGAGYLV